MTIKYCFKQLFLRLVVVVYQRLAHAGAFSNHSHGCAVKLQLSKYFRCRIQYLCLSFGIEMCAHGFS